jgi:tetratricopeptide (TPR) repeat protein
MKRVVWLLFGAFGLVLATIQFADDGAAGVAAATTSIPHLIAATVGGGLARTLGIAAPGLADDVGAVRLQVERLDAAGDYRSARRLQRSFVARLRAEGANREVLADALWRLGQLDAEAGYREPAHRRVEWERALEDDRSALELIPLSVTVLLAAGNQALSNGDRVAASDYFRRALASDPASEAARRGLHRALTGEGVPPPFVAPAEWKAQSR